MIRRVPADGWVKAKAFEASRSDPGTIEMVANRSDIYRFFPIKSDYLGGGGDEVTPIRGGEAAEKVSERRSSLGENHK
jgi:hypothetical protein